MRDRVPHILVVDDDPAIREALHVALSGTYVVHIGATGNEACAALRSHPIAAIVLDAVLGDEDGLGLIEIFRRFSTAPVLVLTGYGSEALAVRAFRSQASDYLKKPVNLNELHACLARWVPQAAAASDPVGRARHLLDEHLEKAFHGKGLAGQVGLSEMHLRRRFREALGMTPRRYLIGERLVRAGVLLRTTEGDIQDIAQGLGFSHIRTFRRLFKRRSGLSPVEYRLVCGGQAHGRTAGPALLRRPDDRN